MIEMRIRVGRSAFESGHFVYVWIDEAARPVYVGETGKSVSDRIGLHIRGRERSGAILSRIIHDRSLEDQEYVILAFPIDLDIIKKIATENGAAFNHASYNRARKALERKVYDTLVAENDNLHPARACKWTAESGSEFALNVALACRAKGANAT